MAGSGRKTFAAGAVLSASDVQNYLQDQSVMVFATTAARTSAISSPTEGMVTYIKDVDQVQTYNGTSWFPQSYAQSAGSTTSGAGGAVTVTFPSGRFSVAPIVTASIVATTAKPEFVVITAVTSTGFTATTYVSNSSSSPFNDLITGTSRTVHWNAVQMTGTAAAG
jgi:hypothetical protein